MSKKIVYWDSNAFLCLINKNNKEEQNTMCEAVWEAANMGHLHIVTSALSTAEVICMKGTPKLDPTKRIFVANFFRQDRLSQKSVTRMIAELARDVVWDSAIMPKDATHIATAIMYKVPEFQTYDQKLLNLKNMNVNGFQLNICEPHHSHQLPLIEGFNS